MRVYNYNFLETVSIPSDVVSLLVQIHEFKGKQMNFYRQQPDVLSKLVEVAKIQSTGASNRIEGIHTSDQRLQELKDEHVAPANRDEEEILGYRTVLETIHESHDYISVKPNVILQLHRDLYKFSPYGFGGSYKSADNIIQEKDSAGVKKVRFQPVPAYETAASIDALCNTYNEITGRKKAEPLLVDLLFVLDFLCIHPFNDGNGRMSRLLTLLLLYRHGYMVGKYISIESLIEKTKDNYYSTLKKSSDHWHEGENDFWHFVRYMLGVLLAAYREFESRVVVVSDAKMTKEGRIRKFADEKIGLFTKAEIIQSCPDIAAATIEKVLSEMKREGIIKTVGAGRGTKWCKV
ncbi:Fic family protein [Lachnospiraceae bacterium 54-53]